MKNLEELRIIITGASSGIGRATAIALSAYNIRMVLTSRHKDALTAVANEITSKNENCPKPVIIPCDLTNSKDIQDMINTSKYVLGRIDVLINNAGWGVYGKSELFTMSDFRQVMEINYFGTLQCMFDTIKLMKQQGHGHIINISSVAAIHGVPYLSAYSASKAALSTLSQGLRAELNESNIKISIVYPGYTQTNFFKNEKKVGSAVRPKGKYMSPEKVAKTIINTLKKGKKDRVLTIEGKLLAFCNNLFPDLVERVMKSIAVKLSS